MKRAAAFVLVPLLGSVACSSVYYSALETLGIEKREVLVDRVGDARDAQAEAQEQFRDALERYQALVGYDGGELESRYESLRSEYEASKAQAQEVRDRIAAVEEVAGALFTEWQAELAKYEDPALRRKSEAQLRDTRRRANQLVTKMKAAATRMNPVLEKLEDQVLFLKHNLNARALGSLQGTFRSLEGDVDRLVKEMSAAVAEANSFLATLEK